jgi:hypothetical protein
MAVETNVAFGEIPLAPPMSAMALWPTSRNLLSTLRPANAPVDPIGAYDAAGLLLDLLLVYWRWHERKLEAPFDKREPSAAHGDPARVKCVVFVAPTAAPSPTRNWHPASADGPATADEIFVAADRTSFKRATSLPALPNYFAPAHIDLWSAPAL